MTTISLGLVLQLERERIVMREAMIFAVVGLLAEGNNPLDAQVAGKCQRVSHSLSGNAGLRGIRYFSKRERKLGAWCGSTTWNGDGMKIIPLVWSRHGFIGVQEPIRGNGIDEADRGQRGKAAELLRKQ